MFDILPPACVMYRMLPLFSVPYLNLTKSSYVYGTPDKVVIPLSSNNSQNFFSITEQSVRTIDALFTKCMLILDSPYVAHW